MSAYEDILRSANAFSDLAAQMDAPNRALREIGEQVQRQANLFLSVVTPEMIEGVEKTARIYEERIVSATEAATARFSVEHSVLAAAAKSVAAFEPHMIDLVTDYSKLLEEAVPKISAFEDYASFFEQLNVKIPTGIVDSDIGTAETHMRNSDLQARLFDEHGQFRRFLNVFVDEEDIRFERGAGYACSVRPDGLASPGGGRRVNGGRLGCHGMRFGVQERARRNPGRGALDRGPAGRRGRPAKDLHPLAEDRVLELELGHAPSSGDSTPITRTSTKWTKDRRARGCYLQCQQADRSFGSPQENARAMELGLYLPSGWMRSALCSGVDRRAS